MDCFVMMPFEEEFSDVYHSIKLAVKSAGRSEDIHCYRLDEKKGPGKITDDLIQSIDTAAFCIADISGENPNVMWEVGYAMALKKPTIFISQNLKTLPFDIKHMRVIPYDRGKLAQTLVTRLSESVQHFLVSDSASPDDLPMIWKDRHSVIPSFPDRYEAAKESLFLIGFSFNSTLNHHEKTLRRALRNSVEIRVLMLHADSLHAKAHDYFADRDVVDELHESLKRLNRFWNSLKTSEQARINVRLTHYLPRFAARIIDGKSMLLNFYLFGSRAQGNPVIELRKDKHKNEFNDILTALEDLYDYGLDKEVEYPNHILIQDGIWHDL